MTKPVATISGGIFAATLFATLIGSERFQARKAAGDTRARPRLEEFNVERADQFTPEALRLAHDDRAVVGIRTKESLDMLRRYLDEVDPEKTDVVVVAADVVPRHASAPMPGLSHADRTLLTAVVTMAEEVGKPVHPLIVPTDDPFEALARIARSIGARELILGHSGRLGVDATFDRVARPWRAEGHGSPGRITVRILGENQDDRRVLGEDEKN